MRTAILACLVALSALAAGCAKPAATQDESPASLDGADAAPDAPTTGSPSTPAPSGSSNGTGPAPTGAANESAGNMTASPPRPNATATYAPGWPSPDAATIRPGIQVNSPTGQCTSNFVYTSPDNRTLYLGIAAHCVEGMKLGDALDVGGVAKGTLAYSSWLVTGWKRTGATPESAQGECSNEKDANVCDYNDFALVKLPDDARAKVHPAMRHFGGPIAMADHASAQTGSKVLTYGNSELRMQTDELAWHEGYVLSQDGWTTTIETVLPGVPGDSGSGVMTADGRALGILVTISYVGGSNGVTSLDLALQYAREKGGLDARLATWSQLDPGMLPAT